MHPSYDYWLTSSGEFTGVGGGGPCESFDVKVEQSALLWSATRDENWKLVVNFNDWLPEQKRQILAEVARALFRRPATSTRSAA